MVSEHPAANIISVNCAEQDDQINSVTIFRANRAEVKRRVKLGLKVWWIVFRTLMRGKSNH
jgi:hypothetical protein